MLRRGATVVLCAMVFLSQWGCGGGKKKGSLCQVGSDCPYACLQGECVTGGCGSTVCTGANEVCVKRADGSEQCVEKDNLQLNPGTETGDAKTDLGSEDGSSDGILGTEDGTSNDGILGSEDGSNSDADVSGGGSDLSGSDGLTADGSTGDQLSGDSDDVGGGTGDLTLDDADSLDDATPDDVDDVDDQSGGDGVATGSDGVLTGDDGGVDGVATGSEGSSCQTVDDCKDICVEKLPNQPGVFSVFSQECKNGKCTRLKRIDDCGLPTCSNNRVVARACVDGACVATEDVIDDCAAKTYQKNDQSPVETGCYACEEKSPAQCVLQYVNGGWGAYRLSTSDDIKDIKDKDKIGECSPASPPDNPAKYWQVHYCDNPVAHCGGIQCYWTTGAPGGPASSTIPEFQCLEL
ncbi:MAG: hypothetical protein KC609_16965 [Myxococcales bacterium]|nr:hypothetical protein [Myxococcales bacterium]